MKKSISFLFVIQVSGASFLESSTVESVARHMGYISLSEHRVRLDPVFIRLRQTLEGQPPTPFVWELVDYMKELQNLFLREKLLMKEMIEFIYGKDSDAWRVLTASLRKDGFDISVQEGWEDFVSKVYVLTSQNDAGFKDFFITARQNIRACKSTIIR